MESESEQAERLAGSYTDEPSSKSGLGNDQNWGREHRLGGFHNAKEPALLFKKENPRHRAMLYLFASGMTQAEVAATMEMTPANVSNVYRQPWFQKALAELMEEEGKEAVTELLQNEALNSLHVITTLRDDPKAPASVRANCAFDILDRCLGKATQRVDATVRSTVANAKTLADIEAEQKRLDEEENHLLRGGAST